MQTKQLYQDCSSRLVALIDPSEHTMGEEAFGHYVNGKFTDHQRRILRQALDGGWPIDVHGVYRNHVAEFQHDRSFRPIDTALARPRHKLFNVHRPSMNIVEDSNGMRRVHYYVFPSRDYVIQCADLLAHQLLLMVGAEKARNRVHRFHYPKAEQEFPKWSGLIRAVRGLRLHNDIVVMGEVGHIASELKRRGFVRAEVRDDEAGFYLFGIDKMFGIQLLVHKITARRVWLVGCSECYWGEASALIAGTFARHGADHIIYSAKTANLIGPQKIHDIVIPSSFILFYEDDTDQFAGPLTLSKHSAPSLFRDMPVCSEFLTGIHLTMASVIRQTRSQSRSYEDKSPATLDAEIVYIVREIEAINHERIQTMTDARMVQFTAVHYSTDFLYRKTKPRSPKHNLNNRDDDYRATKNCVMQRIARMIGTFAMGHGAIHSQALHAMPSSV